MWSYRRQISKTMPSKLTKLKFKKILKGNLSNTYTVIIVLMLVVIIAFSTYLYKVTITQTENSSIDMPLVSNSTDFKNAQIELTKVTYEYGVTEALSWIKEGFVDRKINMFQCHTMAHLIGHEAPNIYKDDFESGIKGVPIDTCEGGYQHGFEAQIVELGGDYRSLLFQLCPLLKEYSIYGRCFHGAGHGFMQTDRSPEYSLGLCDTLLSGPYESAEGCYTGVFSEYTNIIGGYDGHTGLPLPGGSLVKFEGPPIKFCASFSEQHQVSCALEVNGFGLGPGATPEKIETSMLECADKVYSVELQEACLQSMAAVTTQHGLPLHAIKPPEAIYSFSESLRFAYIRGVAGETSEFIRNGQEVDWDIFCTYFPEKKDVTFCEKSIQRN